ncbi:Putative LOC100898776 [Caligus rogercresseyi]|uniref:LOC100898776 n=1 Tax=Caligus rogercresseyi TaxID=217165 RepID=A0A7T8KBP0_CALRO|nr:Putative LOC100898776 [Caligus rogercresseyi]
MIRAVLSTLAFAALFVASQVSSQSPSAYQLPADADLILDAPISTSFSCDGQAYGYYADVDNNCQIFHVCLPIEDDLGQIIETAQYSFVCGNQTVFDQQTLTCNYPTDAFPCQEAPSLYGTVEFGKIPEENL